MWVTVLAKNVKIKDDFEFGNKIVALIERDVNELYSRKLIHQVKIDQIDAITYSFSDDAKEKNVSFKIENKMTLGRTKLQQFEPTQT